MAMRRKYKTGGRVPADPATGLPLDLASADVTLPPEEEPADPIVDIAGDDDAVQRAAHATMRAEELQRAQAQQQAPTIEQVIAAAPISEHKKNFLRSHPEFVADPRRAELLTKHYQAALAAGIDDDSTAINEAILHGVARDLELHQAATAVAQAQSASADAPRSSALPEAAQGGAVRELPPAPLPPAPLPPIKRSAPMTAPVSRDIPTLSGARPVNEKTVTLSPEERIIARNSFGAIKDRTGRLVDLSDAEKEMMYAKNKVRYQRMLAEGSYTDGRQR